MSYEKYYADGWKAGEAGGTPITPQALNHIENGIKSGDNVKNLLDNSYFMNPINQRGSNWDEITTSHYTIDRWKAASKMEVSVIENEGIMLNCNYTATERNGFTQYLEHRPSTGEAVTFAIQEIDGTLHVGSAKWPSSGYNLVFSTETGIQGRVYTDRVSIMIPPDVMIQLAWAALYLGEYDANTLPEYKHKGYAAELLECQRYYYRTAQVGMHGYTYSGATAYAIMELPVVMRVVNKTFSIDEGSVITARGGGAKYTVPIADVSLYANHKTQVRFQIKNFSSSGISVDNALSVLINGGVEVSADL